MCLMTRRSSLLALFLVASVSCASAKTYLTGKLVHVDFKRSSDTVIVVGGPKNVTEFSTYVLYVEYQDLVYSVRLVEKATDELEWKVNAPIEFRLVKDAIYLRRPNGKEMKFPLLKAATLDDGGKRDTAPPQTPDLKPDLPFPSAPEQPAQRAQAVPGGRETARASHCADISAMGPQFEPLAAACEFALSRRNLPNFICQETVQRFNSQSQPPKWRDVDTVTAEVTFVSGKGDRYSNITIDGKKVDVPPEARSGMALRRFLDQLHTGGMWSLAQFGTEIAAVFDPRSRTNFKFDGEVALPSGSSMLFDFHFYSANNYSFEIDSDMIRYNPGLTGSIWTDQKGGQLLRVEANATEIDLRFPMSSFFSATNYGDVKIADIGSFLLPTTGETASCDRPSGFCWKDVISFHGCRKFGAEAHIIPNTGDDR